VIIEPRTKDTTTILRHRGDCGRRAYCFRPECRERFGDYRTLELLPNMAVARCHGLSHPLDDPRLRAVAA
jgi:hypothetical protein